MLNLAKRDGELTNTINSIHSVASIDESHKTKFSLSGIHQQTIVCRFPAPPSPPVLHGSGESELISPATVWTSYY